MIGKQSGLFLESIIPTSVIPSSIVGMARYVSILEFLQDEVKDLVWNMKVFAPSDSTSSNDPLDGPSAMFE